VRVRTVLLLRVVVPTVFRCTSLHPALPCSVLISSGDTGARNPLSYYVNAETSVPLCNQLMASYPAASRFVTAVGATQLSTVHTGARVCSV
jgi:hypothetical protein